MNINDFRSNFEKLGRQYKAADNIGIEKEIIEGIPCYWICKAGAKSSSSVILYLHGGCYVLGSINSHQALVSHLASETDTTILFIEYGLSPEHPFPVAINEVLKIYNYLVNEIQIPHISFMGDSAGGGLIISAVSVLNKEKNTAHLRQIIMISPWVDVRNNSHSITANSAIDPVLTKEILDFFASLYTGNNKLSAMNPIDTLFGAFPPTLILVGSNEILLDDSRMVFSKIAASQPVTQLTIYEDQAHVWLMADIHSKSSKKAINEIKNFMVEAK